jgi:hypothetical protein
MSRNRGGLDNKGGDIKNVGNIESLKDYLSEENLADIFKAFLKRMPGWDESKDLVLTSSFTWEERCCEETSPPTGVVVDTYADDYADDYTETA